MLSFSTLQKLHHKKLLHQSPAFSEPHCNLIKTFFGTYVLI